MTGERDEISVDQHWMFDDFQMYARVNIKQTARVANAFPPLPSLFSILEKKKNENKKGNFLKINIHFRLPLYGEKNFAERFSIEFFPYFSNLATMWIIISNQKEEEEGQSAAAGYISFTKQSRGTAQHFSDMTSSRSPYIFRIFFLSLSLWSHPKLSVCTFFQRVFGFPP